MIFKVSIAGTQTFVRSDGFMILTVKSRNVSLPMS